MGERGHPQLTGLNQRRTLRRDYTFKSSRAVLYIAITTGFLN